MASFVETLLNNCNQYGYIGGPKYQTDVYVNFGGFERRNIDWADARGMWDLGDRNVTKTVKDELLAFFRARRGMAYGFRFRDWNDYEATDWSLQVIDSNTAQLVGVYEAGADQYVRDITKPNSDVTITVDAANFTEFSLDTTTGIVTWTGSPPPDLGAQSVTWSGTFDVPVRFDTDQFRAQPVVIDGDNSVFRIESLPVVEVRI